MGTALHERLGNQPLPQPLTEVNLPPEWGFERTQGKVRDIYDLGESRLALIATDRISAFDRVLGAIPDRGRILNGLTAWWLNQTQDIVPNHMIAVPDPNVMIVKECAPYKVEVVVRGYLTGSTSTSIWKRYEQGEREFGGLVLPDGMTKNMPLPRPVLDPTTKAESGHDQKLTEKEIVDGGYATPMEWQAIKATALTLFQRGQILAAKAGLILVDTKYEFGNANPNPDNPYDDQLVLIDEIHTPDSSRFWDARTNEQLIAQGQEPDNYDKEHFRLWYTNQGYRGEGDPPQMPEDVLQTVRQRYIDTSEWLTGQSFIPESTDIQERITQNLGNWLKENP